jgi:ADP-ribosyl-[dinitrogen reductase] hydrolase
MSVRAGKYDRELTVATRVALEAGDILRRDFHRPGGPRGAGGHAPADAEAENLIRQALQAEFPDCAYCGEETGYSRGRGGGTPRTWLVDPNDGTSAYLKGFRGAAVSIALLVDAKPVLGVVYAYGCPDDRGDLFTWAKGCGPLRRNGEERQRLWTKEPSAEGTVLVSHHADQNPLANAALAAPMRFRAVPSIAYRLALIAAGEGDLAVSLNSPGGWDYGAGHALLLGAGGDLLDAYGRSITYRHNGASSCGGRCFGGLPQVAAQWATHDWDAVLRRNPQTGAELELAWPVPGRAVSDAGVLARAQGCLLGQFAGDSLGRLVEFESAEAVRAQYPSGVRWLVDGGHYRLLAGQPTDDSELALALARSIVKAGGYGEETTARAYASWYRSEPFDCGGTIAQALGPAASAKDAGEPVAAAARQAANVSKPTNGALMRVSPIAVAAALRPRGTAAEWARTDALLTHPNRLCQDANVVFAEAVGFAIRTGAGPRETWQQAVATAREMSVSREIQKAVSDAQHAPPADYTSLAGWVLIALQNAFYQLLHAPGLEAGVVDTVARLGDPDTNAAIAGALLGAVYGRDAIPYQWLDRVLTCRPIRGLEGVLVPRPGEFWPVDALWLAELLLTVDQTDRQE